MLFRDREHFEEELAKSLDEALEKAKFITPEQQKANKAKATANANKDAMHEKKHGRGSEEEHGHYDAPAPEGSTSNDKAMHPHWHAAMKEYDAAKKNKTHRFHHLTEPNTTDRDVAYKIADHLSEEHKAGKRLPVTGAPKSHLSVVKGELCKFSQYGQWELLEKADKPSKADIWKQTVAFLAPHSKGYAAIHEKNQAAEKKPEDNKPKHPPTKPGQRGEVMRTKGAIRSQRTSYPLKDHAGKETGQRGHRSIQVQDEHHWTHDGEKWNHTHTTTSGADLNKK